MDIGTIVLGKQLTPNYTTSKTSGKNYKKTKPLKLKKNNFLTADFTLPTSTPSDHDVDHDNQPDEDHGNQSIEDHGN